MTDFMVASELIQDVKIVNLHVFVDERGRFMETFRLEWFPDTDWSRIQQNRSDSRANVLRGLHYHFNQVDYWYVAAGCIRVGLVDLRPSSPTYMQSQTIEMDADKATGLFIPIGVAHGFVTLTDCTLFYVVSNYYDSGKDEFGVAWNDPVFHLDWGVANPVVSPRDVHNPLLKDVPPARLPR